MYDFKDNLLCHFLNCKELDIALLDECGYDVCEIINDCETTFGKVDINGLVRIMFDYGLKDIETAINDRICEIKAITEERNLDESEESELRALKGLNPFEDIQSSHNYLDTHIYLSNESKKEFYKDYLQGALDRFEEMTGFNIELE